MLGTGRRGWSLGYVGDGEEGVVFRLCWGRGGGG